uniref:Uncharacterized protein n=1 Tax=Zea mays TaxID=4577 RepID=B6U5H6_MAIZE|nr:hypothetical protein [Zea mays]
MPKQIHEIKDFLLTARRKDARSVKIKRTWWTRMSMVDLDGYEML